jgi:hypothetical protein
VKIGKRTAKLLREAMVLAYVEGSRWGQCHPNSFEDSEFPTDSQIVQQVLTAAVLFGDLYPTLSKTDDAQVADAERERRHLELLATLANSSRGSGGGDR